MATDTGTGELSDTAGGEHNRLKQLGKYRIVRRIGAGGMGTVFLAVDDALNRTVALKVLPKDRAENPVLVRRFKAEGQAAAHLEHPNIVRVYEAGEADGFLYMALEYIEGVDVHEFVERRGVIPVTRSTDIIRQTAVALQHAHEKGIVHRDIKPSNLLIKRDGSVKLADMGLARSVDDTLDTNITRAGTTVGTVDYMSPEQARNSKSADVRSDIYSLGCTWYHMLTGHPPFPEGSMTNKLQAHAVSPRPDPRSENELVPEGIVAILQRMMARKPEDRYQTPQELLEDLESSGKMYRGFDESVLAGLASEAVADDECEDPSDSELRMVEDPDHFDLSALKNSAEFDVEAPASSAQPRRPRKETTRREPRRKDPRTKPTPGAADQTVPEQASVTEPERRAPPPPPPPPSSQETSTRSTRTKRKPKSDASASSGRQRRPKRGSVTKAGGATPDLPAKDPASAVDGSAGRSFNLETLKTVIPAVLVIAALGGVWYAVYLSSSAVDIAGGANPYSTGQPGTDALPTSPVPANDTGTGDGSEQSPPADLPPQVSAVPFPGTEDPSTTNEKPLIPDWVEAFRNPPGQAERSLVVRRRPNGDGQVGTIGEALNKLPRGGGLIEIAGAGPFWMDATEIVNLGRVRIQAAAGVHPVIQLRAPSDWHGGALLSFHRTQVELDGLHFVCVDAGPESSVVINVLDGNVSIRNCSLTVDRVQAPPMTALRVAGGAGQLGIAPTGKCLLENVVIRGSSVTSVELDGESADLVIGDCLLASGDAPAIVIHDRGRGASARGAAAPTRGVRLLATTILASRNGLSFRHDSSRSGVGPTDIIMRDCVIAAAEANPQSSMTSLSNWPAGSGGLGESRVDGIWWQVDQSTFAGWSNLLTINGSDGTAAHAVATPDEWRKFWNRGLRSDAVVAEPLVTGPEASLTPDLVHADLVSIVPPLKNGQVPGCRPDVVPQLPSGLIEHVVAATRQPYEPDWLGAGMPIKGEPVRFDLSLRRSLSLFLASAACEDGTHVIAFGSGLKELEPITIENKSVRLEFESVGKAPLVLQPKPAREGAPADEAIITVRNGTLDLVAASIKIPASRASAYPKSAILLEDASLAIRQSVIEGPRIAAASADEIPLPLVRWSQATNSQHARSLLIENSFLVGWMPLIGGSVAWDRLIARNCVLVSESDAIAVSVTSSDQLPATIVLDHCTIAAGGTAVRADVAPAAAGAGALSLFARSSIFAGPPGAAGDRSAVVAHSAGAAQNHTLVWWGSANGYSSRLGGYRSEGNAPPGNFERDWLIGWGDGHEANPLTGKADVLFAKPLPDVKAIAPDSFLLADSAAAATWGPGQEAIGASVQTIGPSHRDEDSPKAGGSPAQQPPRPNSKRNPGF